MLRRVESLGGIRNAYISGNLSGVAIEEKNMTSFETVRTCP